MTRCLKGHRQAWEAGILHQDISVGNILISEHPQDRMRGFLLDFDYSSMTKEPSELDAEFPLVNPLTQIAEEYEVEGKERIVSPDSTDPVLTVPLTCFH